MSVLAAASIFDSPCRLLARCAGVSESLVKPIHDSSWLQLGRGSRLNGKTAPAFCEIGYPCPDLSQCPRAALALSCPMDNERLFLAIVIVGGLLPIAVIVLFLLL